MTVRVLVVDDDQAWHQLDDVLVGQSNLRRVPTEMTSAQASELSRTIGVALPEVEVLILGSAPDTSGIVELRRLSVRERQVLGLIAEGLTNREIAEKLFLAEKTVKNYVSRLLGKLGMARRTQAAVYLAGLRQSGPTNGRRPRPVGPVAT